MYENVLEQAILDNREKNENNTENLINLSLGSKNFKTSCSVLYIQIHYIVKSKPSIALLKP